MAKNHTVSPTQWAQNGSCIAQSECLKNKSTYLKALPLEVFG